MKHAIILVFVTLVAFQFVQPPGAISKIAETIMEVPAAPGLSSSGIMADAMLEESFTTTDVAREVAAQAKEINREQYKAFEPQHVEFFRLNCKPCDDGRVEVTKDEVRVRQSVRLQFSVKYSTDHYVVSFQDAAEEAAQ